MFFTSFTDACFLDALLHVQPQQTSPEASLPSALQISAFQKIHHQRHHDILFLRSGFSNHKRYCNKCPIRYEYLPRRGKKAIHSSAGIQGRELPLYACSRQWIILDKEIQKRCGFLLYCRINILSEHRLIDRTKYSLQFPFRLLCAEDIRRKAELH